MISLQQLLGKEDRFFELFEGSAEECCGSVQGLKTLIQNLGGSPSLDAVVQCRRRDKAIHTELIESLCGSVVTALEQEDIMALANSLYKIPKTVEKIGERMLLAPRFLKGLDLSRQLAMLEGATQTLRAMVQALRRRESLVRMKELNQQLQEVEGDADKFVLELLRNLYESDLDGRQVVFLKDLFELFERVTDRCRDAGNIIVQVTLKAS